ncbi:MAG: glycosyl transferase family 2 [Marinilabiliales bacterium]|nr:MAG: glycosyl transferase family 2 [Marinilabiliales bacterium]
MNYLIYLNYIIYVIISFSTLYIFVFAVAGLFNFRQKKPKDDLQRKFAILIPGYKEDSVVVEVAKEALKQDYPKHLFDIIIIADGFHQQTIEKLSVLDLILIEVELEFSTKSRALNAALRSLDKKYDIAIILDADNLMEKDFLKKVNTSFAAGNKVVQGHRVAKNMDTSYAILDAASEEINNHIFRKGHRVLGLSSALIGSAMAFDYEYFYNMMKKVEVVGGFDKEIEILTLEKKIKIEYLPNAFVYDEKVPNAKVFSTQRRRWLSAQIHFFGKSFIPATRDLFLKGNFDLFNKAIQFILIPRILLLGILFLSSIFSLFFATTIITIQWLLLLTLCILTFIISTPLYMYNMKTVVALLKIPSGFYHMFISLLKIKGANKKFINTKHTYNAFQKKSKKKVN